MADAFPPPPEIEPDPSVKTAPRWFDAALALGVTLGLILMYFQKRYGDNSYLVYHNAGGWFLLLAMPAVLLLFAASKQALRDAQGQAIYMLTWGTVAAVAVAAIAGVGVLPRMAFRFLFEGSGLLLLVGLLLGIGVVQRMLGARRLWLGAMALWTCGVLALAEGVLVVRSWPGPSIHARVSMAESDLGQFRLALEEYSREHHALPDSLEEILPTMTVAVHQYDPWTKWVKRPHRNSPYGYWHAVDGLFVVRSVGVDHEPDLDFSDLEARHRAIKDRDDYLELRKWIRQHEYDPSNGVLSAGDIIRSS